MNHLLRELAPIPERAWELIDEEAVRVLRHFLAGRKLIDTSPARGWDHSAINLGRTTPLDGALVGGVDAALRSVQPLVEFRTPFTLSRAELADAARGADGLDLDAVVDAARVAATAEAVAIFHGYEPGGITGLSEASTHDAIEISDDYNDYPRHVARAVAILRAAGVEGPYAIALGPRCYTGVVETTELGGYPVLHHVRDILGGPIIWAPAVNGAVVLSRRGGDSELILGGDFAIGFDSASGDDVELYIEESFTFRIEGPEAAIALIHPA